jgi:serine/threonine protein kinase
MTRRAGPLDQFTAVRTLADSLYGKVRLAQHNVTKQLVAIKISDLSKLRKTKSLDDPLSETAALRELLAVDPEGDGSEHIAQLIVEATEGNYHFAISDFCAGGDLYSVCAQASPGLDKTARYFLQMCRGVEYLHRNDFVHLDLSLENILLGGKSSQQVKICDFGVAQKCPPGYLFNSRDGTSKHRPGKTRYMAPEVFAGKPFCGKKADVFTLGVDLFILLTGVPPFELPSRTDARFVYLADGKLRHLLNHWGHADIPDEVVELLSCMLCPEASRWSIKEVLSHPWLLDEASRVRFSGIAGMSVDAESANDDDSDAKDDSFSSSVDLRKP